MTKIAGPRSDRYVGIDDGLEILAEVRVTQGVPVVCDFSDRRGRSNRVCRRYPNRPTLPTDACLRGRRNRQTGSPEKGIHEPEHENSVADRILEINKF